MSEQERKSFIASGELISIADASEFTPYSAEYLSLRARTGHLKATKIARNWVTTRAAVLSYLRAQKQKHCKSIAKEIGQSRKESQRQSQPQFESHLESQSQVMQPALAAMTQSAEINVSIIQQYSKPNNIGDNIVDNSQNSSEVQS